MIIGISDNIFQWSLQREASVEQPSIISKNHTTTYALATPLAQWLVRMPHMGAGAYTWLNRSGTGFLILALMTASN